jgi:DNA mismatch repair ATPase MutS
MHACRTVLSDVQARSLVLVDELGKGTEVVSGTAIASGILKDLAAKKAM